MGDFTLWILLSDKRASDSWRRVFVNECLNISVISAIEQVSANASAQKGIALLEYASGAIKNPAMLKELTSLHSNVSFIIAAKKEKITNDLISEFLESGADDFIPLDIDERVLLSKLRAHIRRTLPNLSCAKNLIVSKSGDVDIDRSKRMIRVGLKTKKPVELTNLTPKEFEIFALLLSHENDIVSRSFIMEEIWLDKAGKVNSETIDKHVESLRQKLGNRGKSIKTVYGSGYSYKDE